MLRQPLWTLVVVVLLASAAGGQGSMLASLDAKAFIGTWVFAMTEPLGAQETVRIIDKGEGLSPPFRRNNFLRLKSQTWSRLVRT